MTQTFDHAFALIVAAEGGYSDDARDPGIHAHELAHVGQWALTTAAAFAILLPIALHHPDLRTLLPASHGVFGLLYLTSPVFRLHCEIQAYKIQARHYADDRIPRFARAIATKYNLQITPEAAEKLLREP
jgi:hypothetical protein